MTQADATVVESAPDQGALGGEEHWSAGADPGLVENPVFFPQACETCGSQKGPMLDWQVDRPAMGPGASIRIYQCRACARRSAELWGFAAGDKLDELIEASEVLEQERKKRASSEEDCRAMAAALTDEQQRHRATQTQLDHLRDREHQNGFLLQQIQSLSNQLTITGG